MKEWGGMLSQEANEKKENVIITSEDLHKPVYEFVKRIFDVIFSSLALVILSPVFLITAIAVKTDGGPVFYTQKRAGKNNKVFNMYKFRSMCLNAENLQEDLMKCNEMDGPVFKMKDDPRITKVGKFIRKYSIDELPQLVNILKGEMSIVGPRPPLLREVEQYNDYQMQRLLVKPGLTCFWQAYGRSALSFADWMDMDMKYIKRRNLRLDAWLIARTMYAVIFKRGAY
ncbi:MAG: sugar transferase [Hominilimicola sp.]